MPWSQFQNHCVKLKVDLTTKGNYFKPRILKFLGPERELNKTTTIIK